MDGGAGSVDCSHQKLLPTLAGLSNPTWSYWRRPELPPWPSREPLPCLKDREILHAAPPLLPRAAP